MVGNFSIESFHTDCALQSSSLKFLPDMLGALSASCIAMLRIKECTTGANRQLIQRERRRHLSVRHGMLLLVYRLSQFSIIYVFVFERFLQLLRRLELLLR